jgi:hypothetical protein
MTTQTIHHASHPDFNVENYHLVTVLDMQPEFGGPQGYCSYLKDGNKPVQKVGQCSHCGAHLRYAAVLEHVNGERILVGEDCLNNRFSDSQEAFQRLRDNAKARAERSRKIGKLESFLVDNPDFRPLVEQDAWQYGDFVGDVVAKLIQYGELSERQVYAVRRAIESKQRFMAQREAEKATMSPAPSGRVKFQGTVISEKITEGYYGVEHKMLVKADGNYKVWTTVPASMQIDGLKGAKIELTATLAPKADDPTFAIGKRPTGRVLLPVMAVMA